LCQLVLTTLACNGYRNSFCVNSGNFALKFAVEERQVCGGLSLGYLKFAFVRTGSDASVPSLGPPGRLDEEWIR
jgi:hypothetical protein